MKHTPGPWEISGKYIGTTGYEVGCKKHDHGSGFKIAAIRGPSCKQLSNELEANAHLIAATPDLLEHGYILAVLSLQSDRYSNDPDFRDAVDNLLSVCRGAKGE